MEKLVSGRPSDPSIEIAYRTDAKGNHFGEWSSGIKEQSPSDELHLQNKELSVDIKTDSGGPESKYGDKNEDAFLLLVDEEGFFLSVLDGAGGTQKGRKAACLASEALRHMHQKSPTADLRAIMNATDTFIGDNAEGGVAAGVVIRGKKEKAHWNLQIGALGDCKVMTIRNGKKRPEGTSTLQNVATGITKIKGDSQGYYCDILQNKILGGFGLYVRQPRVEEPEILSLTAEAGDQLVVASDALWDLVSEYEVEELSKQYRGKALQEQLYELAYRRNNTTGPFMIQHDATTTVIKEFSKMYPPEYAKAKFGDNITIAVVDLLAA
jgi:serine/threonine protein phosphatase PrpC